MKKIVLTCAAVLALSSGSAQALSFDAGSVTLGSADLNQVFVVAFDGNVSTMPVAGLSALAAFQLTGYDTTLDRVTFNVLLRNTSALDSRVSAIGFNSNPNVLSGTVSAVFSNVVVGSSFPNGFGTIETCAISNANTCNGGGGDGVGDGVTAGFILTLTFANLPGSLDMSNFGVRYQSIVGAAANSGTGHGTPRPPQPGDPTPFDVPEPTSMGLLGLALLGAGFARRRK